jgi:hypothetical protein
MKTGAKNKSSQVAAAQIRHEMLAWKPDGAQSVKKQNFAGENAFQQIDILGNSVYANHDAVLDFSIQKHAVQKPWRSFYPVVSV